MHAEPGWMRAPRTGRDTNLDVIRAVAIVMVLIHHFAIQWPIESGSIRAWTQLGAHGLMFSLRLAVS